LHVDRCARKGYRALVKKTSRASKKPPFELSLSIEHGPHRGISRAEILRRIGAMILHLQLKNIEVSFVLTNDQTVHQLNKVYRKIDRPTDVLAFAMREGDFGGLTEGVLGDVIVSVETARKQAEAGGHAVLEEVTMLAAHGLLHLLGWDHDTPAKDRRMRAETARLCIAAGAPDAAEAARTSFLEASTASRTRNDSPSKARAKRALSQNRSPSRGQRGRA